MIVKSPRLDSPANKARIERIKKEKPQNGQNETNAAPEKKKPPQV